MLAATVSCCGARGRLSQRQGSDTQSGTAGARSGETRLEAPKDAAASVSSGTILGPQRAMADPSARTANRSERSEAGRRRLARATQYNILYYVIYKIRLHYCNTLSG